MLVSRFGRLISLRAPFSLGMFYSASCLLMLFCVLRALFFLHVVDLLCRGGGFATPLFGGPFVRGL